jgi:DNA-binding transcriptional LysR family regulator
MSFLRCTLSASNDKPFRPGKLAGKFGKVSLVGWKDAMDRLRAMQIFAVVAEAGSLSGASRELGVPLTTVSRQLAALERHVGTPLMVRTTRQLALTDAGRDYLETCRSFLSELEAAEARLAGKDDAPRGKLVLTAPVVFGRLQVLPVVLDYLRRYPGVTVKMVLADRVIDLVDESIDVGVRIGALPDSAMVARQAGTVHYVVCASPAYLQTRGEPAIPRDVSKHDCVVFSGLETGGSWCFLGPKGTQRVRIRSRLSVNTAEAAVDAAIAGIGLARVLSYQVKNAIAEGRLRLVLEDFKGPAIPVNVVHRQGRLQQAKVKCFVALACELLSVRFKL